MSEQDRAAEPLEASKESEAEGEAATAHAKSDEADGVEVTPDSDREPVGLAESLLHTAIAADDQPGRRWAYPNWFKLVVSAFILFHGVILLVHNLPSKGLSKGIHQAFNKKLEANRYMRATGNTQSWAMFAPNPHRSNMFMKVLVKDKDGEIWDLKQDIYKKRSYPYLFYDRMGKINRRIIDQKGYRRHYAAWVCRTWEKEHKGESAVEVQFVKMWTRIPPPHKLIKRAKGNIFRMGYDPNNLHLNQREEDTIRCRTTRHAQLPNYLRERYGMEPAPDGHFRALHVRTWWDKKEQQGKRDDAKKRRAERRDGARGRASR